jgi:hypothetical protein
MQPHATSPEEFSEVLAFLQDRFDVHTEDSFLHPELARWKYFATGPVWDRTRSFILRMDDGSVAAHAYICPARIWNGQQWLSSYHVADRAGNPKMPGAALFLAILMAEQFDVFLGIGGNEISLRIARADRVIAKPYGTLQECGRILRPFRKLLNSAVEWKSPFRLGRDLAWNRVHPLPSAGRWSALAVERFGQDLPAVDTSRPPLNFLPCLRTPALLNYFLDCPRVRFTGFLLQRDGVSQGHVLLSGKGEEARVADLWIGSDDPADWSACYGLAARCAAAAYPSADNIRVAAFPPFIQDVLVSAGFRVRRVIPTSLTDKKTLLRPQPLFPHLNMIDWDWAYLF